MRLKRSSGVLLHISSLPSRGGIGDLGPAAHEFLEFLSAARLRVWQVLPLGPTGYGNSPYAGISAFAGNPLLISLEILADWGWIAPERIAGLPGPGSAVDYEQVEARKLPLLREAAANFLDRGPSGGRFAEQWSQFQGFCRTEAGWLRGYALFAEIRRQHGDVSWAAWPEPLRRRDPAAIAEFTRVNCRSIDQEEALQFALLLQWNQLRTAAGRSGIRILGDVAIFVNMDSADVWEHPELFELDRDLNPVRVSGVPPDYFSATGQRWGNPLYRWDVLAERGFDWWIERIGHARRLCDLIRLDHFRGFEAYWAIPASEQTAVRGQWMKAPGRELLRALEAAHGPLPLVAEDLGVITPEVEALRTDFGLPGMKVIQFGFTDKGAHVHLPHRYTEDTVAYTGTHDNDTTQGWWGTAAEGERAAAEDYVGPVAARPAWPLIRAVWASPAGLAVAPVQDLLELGSEARMNTPSVSEGNWSWRAPEGAWGSELAARMARLVEATDREGGEEAT